MAIDATGRESDKFMLRLPDGMRERLKETAASNKRSMNAEIVARLEASLLRDKKALEAEDPAYLNGRRLVPDDLVIGMHDALDKINAVTEYMRQFKIKRSPDGEILEVTRTDPEAGAEIDALAPSTLASKRALDL